MINIPTTLVLGAGASQPYGFPLGYELFDDICGFLRPATTATNEKKSLQAAGFEISRLEEFRSELLRSGLRSVDAFLEGRADLIAVGKAAIACSLISKEIPENVVECPASKNNWYAYLWSRLRTLNPADLPRNRLSIITFNYDRSLEYFLYNAISATYNRGDSEVRPLLDTIPIVHLHGQLGLLREATGYGRGFSPHRGAAMLNMAGAGITIIHEADDGDTNFTRAWGYLSKAHRICFLGFGYNHTNVRRLHIEKYEGQIFGTTMGLKSPEINEVTKQFDKPFQHQSEDDNQDFLRRYGILLE